MMQQGINELCIQWIFIEMTGFQPRKSAEEMSAKSYDFNWNPILCEYERLPHTDFTLGSVNHVNLPDWPKTSWFEIYFYVSCASFVAILLTTDNGPFFVRKVC